MVALAAEHAGDLGTGRVLEKDDVAFADAESLEGIAPGRFGIGVGRFDVGDVAALGRIVAVADDDRDVVGPFASLGETELGRSCGRNRLRIGTGPGNEPAAAAGRQIGNLL